MCSHHLSTSTHPPGQCSNTKMATERSPLGNRMFNSGGGSLLGSALANLLIEIHVHPHCGIQSGKGARIWPPPLLLNPPSAQAGSALPTPISSSPTRFHLPWHPTCLHRWPAILWWARKVLAFPLVLPHWCSCSMQLSTTWVSFTTAINILLAGGPNRILYWAAINGLAL